jgi:hypothetical protein
LPISSPWLVRLEVAAEKPRIAPGLFPSEAAKTSFPMKYRIFEPDREIRHSEQGEKIRHSEQA